MVDTNNIIYLFFLIFTTRSFCLSLFCSAIAVHLSSSQGDRGSQLLVVHALVGIRGEPFGVRKNEIDNDKKG